jgi:hypothetical protein
MMLFLLGMAMLQASSLSPETWKERNNPDVPVLPACNLGRGATIAHSIASLPKAASTEISRFFRAGGGISEADGSYNSTDVTGDGVPQRRFLRAYHVQNYWIIWYERGGFVTGRVTLALELDKAAKGGAEVYQAMPGTVLSGDLCAATKALLVGVRSGQA